MRAHNRREFLVNVGKGAAACALGNGLSSLVGCGTPGVRPASPKIFLVRYDTEGTNPGEMKGFLSKAIDLHRKQKIPATFFCMGRAIEAREGEFREFAREVKDDPIFDIQDHSYSHIGLGYEKGRTTAELEADYRKSFDAHERVIGKRPIGTAICGTANDGKRLKGFDETDKSRKEFEMIVGLGIRMINAFLSDVGESRFANFGKIGHPEVMGFPNGNSDTAWMSGRKFGDPATYIMGYLDAQARSDLPLCVLFHDWVAWNFAPDKELTHVARIADKARALGYELRTHIQCYRDNALWQDSKKMGINR